MIQNITSEDLREMYIHAEFNDSLRYEAKMVISKAYHAKDFTDFLTDLEMEILHLVYEKFLDFQKPGSTTVMVDVKQYIPPQFTELLEGEKALKFCQYVAKLSDTYDDIQNKLLPVAGFLRVQEMNDIGFEEVSDEIAYFLDNLQIGYKDLRFAEKD